MGTAIKHRTRNQVKPPFVIFDQFHHPIITATLTLSGRMSKITNDGLTRSGAGRFIAVYIWQHWASNSFTVGYLELSIGW